MDRNWSREIQNIVSKVVFCYIISSALRCGLKIEILPHLPFNFVDDSGIGDNAVEAGVKMVSC